MSRRFVRVLLVAAALCATAGLSYRAVQDELAAGRSLEHARAAERAADLALQHVGDLRAALHACVAPGQGHEFWTTRAGVLVEGLRAHVRDLSAAAAAVGQTVDPPAEDTLRKLSIVEVRVRGYLRDDQARLAADIIFTEGRDHSDTLRSQIVRLRDGVSAWDRAEQRVVRRQQALLAAGALIIWTIVAVLLVPVGGREMLPPPLPAEPLAVSLDAAETLVASAPATDPGWASEKLAADPAAIGPSLQADLRAAADICSDLARVGDAQQISPLLERSARVLDASGLIVWLGGGDRLFPAASWGYEPRVMSRITSISRDAANLTASAYRSCVTRTSPADHSSPAAFGVPLLGPAGPVGVLSGEIRSAPRVSDEAAALAAIFAAQLATLVGSMPPAGAAVGDVELR